MGPLRLLNTSRQAINRVRTPLVCGRGQHPIMHSSSHPLVLHQWHHRLRGARPPTHAPISMPSNPHLARNLRREQLTTPSEPSDDDEREGELANSTASASRDALGPAQGSVGSDAHRQYAKSLKVSAHNLQHCPPLLVRLVLVRPRALTCV
jgi:hypothetical protein